MWVVVLIGKWRTKILMSLSRKAFDSRQDNKQKTLDPGAGRDPASLKLLMTRKLSRPNQPLPARSPPFQANPSSDELPQPRRLWSNRGAFQTNRDLKLTQRSPPFCWPPSSRVCSVFPRPLFCRTACYQRWWSAWSACRSASCCRRRCCTPCLRPSSPKPIFMRCLRPCSPACWDFFCSRNSPSCATLITTRAMAMIMSMGMMRTRPVNPAG